MSERLPPFLASHWGIGAACFEQDIARRARAPPRRFHSQDHQGRSGDFSRSVLTLDD